MFRASTLRFVYAVRSNFARPLHAEEGIVMVCCACHSGVVCTAVRARPCYKVFSVKRGPTGGEAAAPCPCDQALLSAVSPPCVRPGSYWGIRPLYFPLPAAADGRHEIERFVWYLNSVVPLTGALEVSFAGLPNSLRKKFATAPLSGAACYSSGVSQTKWPARHG